MERAVDLDGKEDYGSHIGELLRRYSLLTPRLNRSVMPCSRRCGAHVMD
ncbi:MAG: hypothetical protein ABIP48_20040 [Planctomycetota bacterium]